MFFVEPELLRASVGESTVLGPMAFLSLLSHAPIARVGLTQGVASRVRDDELRALTIAVDDCVLAEGPTKIHCFFAIDVVHQPSGFAPSDFGLVLVADALFDAVAPQDQQFAHYLMPLFVDSAGQEHGARIVRSEDGEGFFQERGQQSIVPHRFSIEGDTNCSFRGGKFVNRAEVGAKKILVHGFIGGKSCPTTLCLEAVAYTPDCEQVLGRGGIVFQF